MNEPQFVWITSRVRLVGSERFLRRLLAAVGPRLRRLDLVALPVDGGLRGSRSSRVAVVAAAAGQEGRDDGDEKQAEQPHGRPGS